MASPVVMESDVHLEVTEKEVSIVMEKGVKCALLYY